MQDRLMPEYTKNFPRSWDEEKIVNYVNDISTDPSIPWQQITSTLGIPPKYIVDGIREGMHIRVIIEPTDRGILTAYTVKGYQ